MVSKLQDDQLFTVILSNQTEQVIICYTANSDYFINLASLPFKRKFYLSLFLSIFSCDMRKGVGYEKQCGITIKF